MNVKRGKQAIDGWDGGWRGVYGGRQASESDINRIFSREHRCVKNSCCEPTGLCSGIGFDIDAGMVSWERV